MSSPVEQIKAKLSIVDVVGSYIKLEKAGSNFKAKCPFHNEKTGSFFVSPDRGTYYCFGCGAKGDIISFVEQFEGLDFIGALRILAERAGVPLTREPTSERTERQKLYLTMEHATLFYQRELSGRAAVREYLIKRGLTPETIKNWRLGYAPAEWEALSKSLQSKGVSLGEMERVGLIKKSEQKAGFYDRFRGRVMFPIFDASSRVVGFSGRQFESDGTQAKYINSPETSLFEKSKILYGYDKAKLAIRQKGFTILVEGQMDLLMAHQAGFTNTVASSGTALTREHVELIKRLSSELVICYDGDSAGEKAATRGFELALQVGLTVKIATLPEGKDPADLAKENPEAFAAAITNARHIVDVLLEKILKNSDRREQSKAARQDLLPFVAAIESDTEKDIFIRKIAHGIGVTEQALWEDLKKIKRPDIAYTIHSGKEGVFAGFVPSKTTQSRQEGIARRLFSLLFWQEKQPAPAVAPLYIREKIGTIVGKEREKALSDQHGALAADLVFEAEVSLEKYTNLPAYAEELLLAFEEEYIREQCWILLSEIRRLEREDKRDLVSELLVQYQGFSNRLGEIQKAQRSE